MSACECEHDSPTFYVLTVTADGQDGPPIPLVAMCDVVTEEAPT